MNTLIPLTLGICFVSMLPMDDGKQRGDTHSSSPTHSELKAYPAAKEGMQRFVIVLPHKDRKEEGDFLVELVAGKVIEVDGVNRYRLGSRIETKVVQGWGYNYYEVVGSDRVASTLMAVPEGTPKTKQLVAGEPLKIRYNSRLPVVVYAPRGFEIRYRIWQAPSETKKAPQG